MKEFKTSEHKKEHQENGMQPTNKDKSRTKNGCKRYINRYITFEDLE